MVLPVRRSDQTEEVMIKVLLVMWIIGSPGSIFGTADLDSPDQCEKKAVEITREIIERGYKGTQHLCIKVKVATPEGDPDKKGGQNDRGNWKERGLKA